MTLEQIEERIAICVYYLEIEKSILDRFVHEGKSDDYIARQTKHLVTTQTNLKYYQDMKDAITGSTQ
jgi:hypothetical protein